MHGRLILSTRTLTVLFLQSQSCSVCFQTGMVILSKTSVRCFGTSQQLLTHMQPSIFGHTNTLLMWNLLRKMWTSARLIL